MLSLPGIELIPTQPTMVATKTDVAISHEKEVSQDRASIEGKFGWTSLGNKFIPYLIRSEQRYVSLRIMHHQIFNTLVEFFSNEVYSCFEVTFETMTQFEANLLNEINFIHSDCCYGKPIFTTNDELITLEDATNIYEFLNLCYVTLIQKNTKTRKAAGFIRIDSKNLIPYIWVSGRQYVPLFYLDGECKYLEQNSVELRRWPLYYLKLCCKIQGVRESLFDKNYLDVVDVELVKRFFHSGTSFEDSWPNDSKMECLIKQKPNNNTSNMKENITEITTTTIEQQKFLLHNVLCSYIQIPEYATPTDEKNPYYLLRTNIGKNCFSFCVNLMPFDSSTLMVTMDEAVAILKIPAGLFVNAVNCLKICVYLPNKLQRKVLATAKLGSTMGLLNLQHFLMSINAIISVCYRLSLNQGEC